MKADQPEKDRQKKRDREIAKWNLHIKKEPTQTIEKDYKYII